MSSSSWSATASISWWWYSAACSASSAGISPTSVSVPSESVHTSAFISMRSTTPRKCSSWPIGSCTGNGPRAEPVDHRLHRGEEVGADAVHLVHEGDARHAVAVGLAPDGLRLRLDTGDGVEDGHGAVEHAQRALDLDGKVHVPGRIDNVHPEVAPERRRRGRRDGDAALLLLDHPVHDGGALVHLAHLVRAARVVEDPLRRRRLARVDVGHDPDVPDVVERDGSLCCHLHRAHAHQR